MPLGAKLFGDPNALPIFVALCLALTGLRWNGWTDRAAVLLGLSQIAFFGWRATRRQRLCPPGCYRRAPQCRCGYLVPTVVASGQWPEGAWCHDCGAFVRSGDDRWTYPRDRSGA